MEKLCGELLQTWCEALRTLQVRGTGNPRLDGGILCPACGRIHGRCFEAMEPFLYMASVSKEEIWIHAAEQLFFWAEQVVSQPDGSYLNDIDSDWKGTTVFNVIQLAECLLFHESGLPEDTRCLWKARLKKAAEFLYTFDEINGNNINYPVSNALALYECGLVLREPRFLDKARELAAMAGDSLTEHGLLFGEGVPRDQKSPRGCYPVDIGYNVEETLPSLALYGSLSGDTVALQIAEKGLAAQLMFMVGDGAWDNSFGTRNFKWTYWGSRTCDGCALGYLLLADRHSEFVLAAKKNMELMQACTYDGLLAGGLHYHAAGQPSCVHHTFTHAKVLAGILERKLCREVRKEEALPRQKAEGIHCYPEIDSWLVTRASLTATVTAYDWEYLPGGHVSGGTLSLLHHERAGTLLCAGVGQYTLKEPNNMQIPMGGKHECLALRIEKQVGDIRYSSIYENEAVVLAEGGQIKVRGRLKDIRHRSRPDMDLSYTLLYEWEENVIHIRADFSEGSLICPVISRCDETVEILDGNREMILRKEQAAVSLRTSGAMRLPYGRERIFNLVPGVQALRVELDSNVEGVELLISVKEGGIE